MHWKFVHLCWILCGVPSSCKTAESTDFFALSNCFTVTIVLVHVALQFWLCRFKESLHQTEPFQNCKNVSPVFNSPWYWQNLSTKQKLVSSLGLHFEFHFAQALASAQSNNNYGGFSKALSSAYASGNSLPLLHPCNFIHVVNYKDLCSLPSLL